jgi:hypothetical protein
MNMLVLLATIFSMIPFYWVVQRTIEPQDKRRAWILTLHSSIVCSTAYVYHICQPAIDNWVYGETEFSRNVAWYFAAYLVVDSIGMIWLYPSDMSCVHHGIYLCAVLFTIYHKMTLATVPFYPFEFSSIPLSIGHIWPKYRQDWVFGISFGLFRVLYNGKIVYLYWIFRENSPISIWYIPIIPWLVHCWWWYRWLKRYR